MCTLCVYVYVHVFKSVNQSIHLFISLSGLTPTVVVDQRDPQPRNHGRH